MSVTVSKLDDLAPCKFGNLPRNAGAVMHAQGKFRPSFSEDSNLLKGGLDLILLHPVIRAATVGQLVVHSAQQLDEGLTRSDREVADRGDAPTQ